MTFRDKGHVDKRRGSCGWRCKAKPIQKTLPHSHSSVFRDAMVFTYSSTDLSPTSGNNEGLPLPVLFLLFSSLLSLFSTPELMGSTLDFKIPTQAGSQPILQWILGSDYILSLYLHSWGLKISSCASNFRVRMLETKASTRNHKPTGRSPCCYSSWGLRLSTCPHREDNPQWSNSTQGGLSPEHT